MKSVIGSAMARVFACAEVLFPIISSFTRRPNFSYAR
ncbi:hypothetical protein BVRB_4g087100 [Beta vulgaris subsp. vulgaris]|uniref:Uncharacterized protein n=1 Tax=Beta vulgaris subsp. vulgaris TaxID=3555 RepID=A0A0J8FB41_BETVV|nr:hypothetical protein BVRB_4g087100 [Beta vulgaris subsp. vulgaris]